MTLRTTGFALAGRRIANAITPCHRPEPLHHSRARFSSEPSRIRSRFSTLPLRQKDHPRSDQGSLSKTEHTSKTSPPSTRVSAPTSHIAPSLTTTTELSFESRLQFLSQRKGRNHPSAALDTRSSNHTNDLSDPYTTAASGDDQTNQHRAMRKKRYRPGFQPGDFICPQCGSHNHRPPEYNIASRLESKVLMKRDKSGSKSQPSSRIPIPRQRLSRYQTRIEMSERKYPYGATDRCFECGFGTLQEIVPAQDTSISMDGSEDTTMSEEHEARIQSSSSEGLDRESGSGSSIVRSDFRLSKPRDFVCPHCQTVNYNDRLYCVGCGTLALGVRESIERGSSGKSRRAVKSSSSHSGKVPRSE